MDSASDYTGWTQERIAHRESDTLLVESLTSAPHPTPARNKSIHKFLDQKKIILTTSTDAGTQKTFEKVRGVKKGFLKIFENLKKYNTNKNGKIIIKYILTNENYNQAEIDAFVNLIIDYQLTNCNFEISTDYKFENLDLEKSYAIIYFYNKLKNSGCDFIHFDDHVRKRLYNT